MAATQVGADGFVGGAELVSGHRRAPAVGVVRPAATPSSVLFPEPLGPTTATNSPRATFSQAPRRATVSTSPSR